MRYSDSRGLQYLFGKPRMGDLIVWILVSILLIAGIFAAIFLVGAMLPRSHQVTRTLALHQTAEAVWQVVTDYATVPAWHVHILRVERLPDQNGHEVWKETYPGDYVMIAETIDV